MPSLEDPHPPGADVCLVLTHQEELSQVFSLIGKS